MKLILDSETLNINCKMTEVQEVFSAQPLSNGLVEDIKSGDICNGNSKVIEEQKNGIEKSGNGETGEIVEEKFKIIEEPQTKDIETDDISELISKESNDVVNHSEPEKEICFSSPIDEGSNSNIEETQIINKKEPAKSPSATQKDTELQGNTDRDAIEKKTEAKAVTEENTLIKNMCPTEADLTSDKCESDIDVKPIKNQVELTDQEIHCKEPIKIDETVEKESEPVPKCTESIKIDETVEKESEPVPKCTEPQKLVENESNPIQIIENIANESDAVEITKNIDPVTSPNVDVLSCDKSEIASDDVTATKLAEFIESVADESVDRTKDEVDNLPKAEVHNSQKDEVDNLPKDEVVNDSNVDNREISQTSSEVVETPMETDIKESLDSTMIINSPENVIESAAADVNGAQISPDTASKKIDDIIEIDCTEKEQVIDIDSSEKETTAKGDSEGDTVFNCEDSSDGCTVVETKEGAATIDMDVDTRLENSPNESKNSNADVITDASKSAAVSSKMKTICALSNTLDIISDDEDETPPQAIPEPNKENSKVEPTLENKCISLDDDDDIMLIDEDPSKDDKNKQTETKEFGEKPSENVESKDVSDSPVVDEDKEAASKLEELLLQDEAKELKTVAPVTSETEIEKPDIIEKTVEKSEVKPATDPKPLVPSNFLKTFKVNVAEMTREELEEFCLIKIVEGIVEKSNLSEIKAKLKTMAQSVEEWRKKAMMLTKQNRDLQIVLKTVQEEQKKRPELPITPLKITRSVGMQVFMTEANERGVNGGKRGRPSVMTGPKQKPLNVNQRIATKPVNTASIPVPRLVPAAVTSPAKPRTPSQVQSSAISSNTGKATPATTVKTPPIKAAEKRPFSSGPMSFTVDLTDDEPPAKQMPPRQAPVRLVAQQHLMAPRAQVNNVNSPRKVYIPINSQNQNQLRPGNAIMVKSVSPLGPRQRPPMVRLPNNSPTTVRPMRATNFRHPAPLPDVAKQQQPPNWKALPPSPDLKISKVENGIVISWKIEGYQEDSYEEIASYQLYAYQETSSPPSTLLWKKIGDVKALPLPMACTLTQFMAGYKYYFAVRAVDIRSRIGPFSLPGSILLLNK